MFNINFSADISFLRKQSSSFKDAFLGPIKYEQRKTSRSKRQLDNMNEDITSLDQELNKVDDQAILHEEENLVNSEDNEEHLPSNPEGEDEAINCNWNIKVIDIFIQLFYILYFGFITHFQEHARV